MDAKSIDIWLYLMQFEHLLQITAITFLLLFFTVPTSNKVFYSYSYTILLGGLDQLNANLHN